MSTAFDTLHYAKKLREAGFTEQQAEAQADALRAVVDANLATKHDIERIGYKIETLRQETKRDIENLRQETRQDIETLRQETKQGIETLRQETRQDIENLRQETKQGIETLRQETKQGIETLHQETKHDIETMRHSLSHQIRESESRTVLRLGGIMVAGIVVLAALMKLL